MSAPTFAQKMLKKLEEALCGNVAVGSISVDGTTTTFTSRSQLLTEYQMWQGRVAKEQGRRSMFRSANMSSTMPQSGC